MRCVVLTAVNIKFFYTEDGASTFLGTLLHVNQIIRCHISEDVDVNKHSAACMSDSRRGLDWRLDLLTALIHNS
jgi:hypothetical protein